VAIKTLQFNFFFFWKKPFEREKERRAKDVVMERAKDVVMEDQTIWLFPGLFVNPDMPLNP
jgi:hypothetical protein